MKRPNPGTLCDFLPNQPDVVSNGGHVIAAGPLSKQPCTMPYRVVLVQYPDGQFSVHYQLFDAVPLRLNSFVSDRNSWLDRGDYFAPDRLVAAAKRFAERVAENAEYLATLYRKLPEIRPLAGEIA